jgi:SAM-dependent methyltransferase
MRSYGADKYKLLYLLSKHGINVGLNQASNNDSFFYAKRMRPKETGPNAARDDGQAAHIMYHVKNALDDSPLVFENYLDLGGGNGGISVRIGAAVCAKNITVVDVQPQAIDGATWHKDLSKIDTNSIDFITVFFALHHFKDLDGMLRETRRVMKPGSILCIKEHDCWSATDAMMVDIEHSIFMYGSEKIVDDHVVHYMNFTGWETKLAEYEFEQFHMSYFCGPREEITPTRAFMAFFRLTKK